MWPHTATLPRHSAQTLTQTPCFSISLALCGWRLWIFKRQPEWQAYSHAHRGVTWCVRPKEVSYQPQYFLLLHEFSICIEDLGLCFMQRACHWYHVLCTYYVYLCTCHYVSQISAYASTETKQWLGGSHDKVLFEILKLDCRMRNIPHLHFMQLFHCSEGCRAVYFPNVNQD